MTLRDYFHSQFQGGSDALIERLSAIVIDGQPLGGYETSIARNYEEQKRFEELQWAGIALVGCNADFDIREIRSVPPTGVGATADFEATLLDGSVAKLELARVVIGEDLQQASYYTKIARYAEDTLRAACAAPTTFIYRAYDAKNIGEKDARRASDELAEFIQSEAGLRVRSTTLYRAGNAYPTLSRLGVHVCHYEDGGAEARVLWDPLKKSVDRSALLAAFRSVFEKKRNNVRHYTADGKPIWLVLGVPPSPYDMFRALALVQRLGETTLNVSPFARVLVGCYTAGVEFEVGNESPIHRSLTPTGSWN